MAAVVQPLAEVRTVEGPVPLTGDQLYWRTFRDKVLIPSPHNSAVTSITSNNVGTADTFAVTSGARVQIYNSRTRKLVKTISRFNVDDTARSGVLRRDGRILLAGGDSGIVQAFDTSSRAILRQWGHDNKRRQPIHCVRWSSSELTEFMTCGDDRTVRVWDLTEDEPKWIGRGHGDYVRCGTWLPDQVGMLVSGSYDQTVRVWNTRQTGNDGQAVMTFKLSSAVEDVLVLSSSQIAAAAGNAVAILNLVAGKPDVVLCSHQKSVTKMAVAQNGTRLLTAALDGHVKIHSTESWEVVASIKYNAPVLSLSVVVSGTAKEERHLAVGLQTGVLTIRTRLAGAEKIKAKEQEKRMQAMIAGTADAYDRKQTKIKTRAMRARDRGLDFDGEGADIIIENNEKRQKKLTGWQLTLRKGDYAKALDQVIMSNKKQAVHTVPMVTLVTALRHRSALRAALTGRNEERLLPVLDWCRNNVAHPYRVHLVVDVLLMLLDIYSHKLNDWSDGTEDQRKIVRTITKITSRVRKNTENAEKAEGVLGMLDLLSGGG